MILLNLSKFARARIWLDRADVAMFDSTETLKKQLPATRSYSAERRRVSVEFMIPYGGRIGYGLIGATFESDRSNTLDIEVRVGETGRPLGDSLYQATDTPYVGLMQPFGDSTLRGLVESLEAIDYSVPSGIFSIRSAAYSEVGSSEDLFRRISRAVCRIVFLSDASPDEETLQGILTKELFKNHEESLTSG